MDWYRSLTCPQSNNFLLLQQVVRRHGIGLPCTRPVVSPLLSLLGDVGVRGLLNLLPVCHSASQTSPVRFQRGNRVPDPSAADPRRVFLHNRQYTKHRGQLGPIDDLADHDSGEQHTGLC